MLAANRMQETQMPQPRKNAPLCVRVAPLLAALWLAALLPSLAHAAHADAVLNADARTRGIGVLIDCAPDLALDLAARTELTLLVQQTAPTSLQDTRQRIDAQGLLNRRCFVGLSKAQRIPLADNYADLIVLGDARAIAEPEIRRALCPGGLALIVKDGAIQSRITKPLPAAWDDWSHWYHGPDNNPVSTDTELKWPYVSQWYDVPFFAPIQSTVVAAAGRIFYNHGQAADLRWGSGYDIDQVDGWADMKGLVVARNACNGAVLWKHKLPKDYWSLRSGMIATADSLYLLEGGGDVVELDAQTGTEKARIAFDGTAGQAKWIAKSGDGLLVFKGENDPAVSEGPKFAKSKERAEGREMLFGMGDQFAAFDLKTRKTLWVHKEPKPIDGRFLAVQSGRLFFYSPASRLGCIDVQTGRLVWTNADPEATRLLEERKIRDYSVWSNGPSGLANHSAAPCLLATPEALALHRVGSHNYFGFSPTDGKLLWNKPVGGLLDDSSCNWLHAFYYDGLIHTSWSGWSVRVKPLTGELLKERFGGSTCSRMTASTFGMYGQTGFRIKQAPETPAQWGSLGIRSSCYSSTLPAMGMLFSVPDACQCSRAFYGTMAFAAEPAGFARFAPVVEADRLERFPRSDTVADLKTTDADWPVFRANTHHTAASTVSPPSDPQKLWEYAPSAKSYPTAAVAVGDLVCFGTDDGRVRCLSAATGKLQWEHLTAGAIKQPPTVWQGRAYVGSADGFITCLEAATGRALWRFQATPQPRRIRVYGTLSDTWPVHSGIVIQDGVAYAAAGMNAVDGTYVYALDALTGALKWQNNTAGSDLKDPNKRGVSAAGGLTILNGKLWLAAGNPFRIAAFDLATGTLAPVEPCKIGAFHGRSPTGIIVLGGRYLFTGGPLQYQHHNDLSNNFENYAIHEIGPQGQILSQTAWPSVAGRILPAWDDKLIVSNGAEGLFIWAYNTKAFLAALDVPEGQPKLAGKWPQWFECLEIAKTKTKWDHPTVAWGPLSQWIASTALTPAALVVAQASERPPKDKVWSLLGQSRTDGATLWEQPLPSEPVRDGLCIQRDGRIIVPLRNGGVACYGAPTPVKN